MMNQLERQRELLVEETKFENTINIIEIQVEYATKGLVCNTRFMC